MYVIPSACSHPWDSTTPEDEALGRKSSLNISLNRKLHFRLRKEVFLINFKFFPQEIPILPLAFSGQKISGHDVSMQVTGGRIIIWVLLPTVTAILCLLVFCMSGLCD